MLIDAQGLPLKAAPPLATSGKKRMDQGPPPAPLSPSPGTVFPYEAASWSTPEMGNWMPWIRSPDSEINYNRDRIVARARDMVRNDGWAAGGITRIIDNTIGAHFRLSARPDYRSLAIQSGNKNFDAVWADEFRRAAEAGWRDFAEDINRYNDVARQLTVSQQLRLAFRHRLVDGECLILRYWLPENMFRGGAKYANAFLVIDPDRLSNPYQMVDSKYLRGGVEVDDYGAPVAYHIREAEQNDWYNATESMTWKRIAREDDDGFFRVIHDFDRDRAGQHRGVTIFAPVLAHMKMLARYYGVELQAATVAATFGTFVKSPYDPSLVQDALTTSKDDLTAYQSLRADWSNTRPAQLNGVRVPTLFPGESIEQVNAAHPHADFTGFAHEMLRMEASCLGVSAEQITQDWSQTNYASARAALLESWKSLTRRRQDFAVGTATPLYAGLLQEMLERRELPLPNGIIPDFIEAATAYSRCSWLGPGRGWVDPVKEKQGSVLGMDAGLSTLQHECAENSGMDWEEVLDQRRIELDAFEQRKLTPPSWAAMQDATTASEPPEQPIAQ